ncbi:unnamed protein product [Phytomonas sp. Hart1]|nr:unnamed protein product [Phytomonas sp. Hart1]|eukprot:CCW66092.1 unnamed protein product [Phytomonas sp. isolate Hart1]
MDKSPGELASSVTQNSLTREKRPRNVTESFICGAPLSSRHDGEEVPMTRTANVYTEEASTNSSPLDMPVYFTDSHFPRDPPKLYRSNSITSLNARATCIRKAPVKTPVSNKSPGTHPLGHFPSTASMTSLPSLDGSTLNNGSPKPASRRQKWATLLVSTFMQSEEGYEEERVKDICTHIATAIPGDGEETKDTFLTLLMNLRDSKNEQLRSQVMKGVLPVEVLVNLNEVDLVNPERRKKLDEDFQKRARDTNLTEIQKGLMTTSTLFSCPSCKARDCSWTQKQTRSGDEPMTIFCTCNVCGNTWRKY